MVGACLATTRAAAQGLVVRLPGLGPTSLSATNTTIVRFRGTNFDRNVHDDEFFSLTERLDLSAQAAPWRLYFRVDGFSPWNHDTTCAGSDVELCNLRANWRPGSYDRSAPNDYANIGNLLPERMNLRYQRSGLTLEAGDYYQVFGRGLSLAFRKVDPIGLDTTLRGGRMEYEHERLTLRAFAGLANPQNLDPISLTTFSDPEDFLTGVSLSTRAGADGDLEVSGHALHADFERDPGASRQDVVDVAGVRVEFPSLLDGALSVYGEADVLSRIARLGVASDGTQRGPTRRSWGRGVYLAAQLVTGRWTVLAEWKDYTNYLVSPYQLGGATPRDVGRIYSTAPSLERDDQRIFTNANTRGGRVRVDYAFPDSAWILSLSSVAYGWSDHFDDRGVLVDPWDPVDGYLTSHTWFGVRRRSRPVFQATGDAGGGGAGSAASAVGAAIPTGGGGGAGGGMRVAPGDFNLVATVGYRREFHLGTARTEAGFEPDFHAGDIKHESLQADFDLAFPIGPNDSLEIRIDNRFERNYTATRLTGFNFQELVAGVRGGIAFTWSHGMPLVVSALLRWDNTIRPAGQAGLFDSPLGVAPDASNRTVDPRLPTLYPAAELRWNFTISNFVRLFAGMTPGGLVCAGGVCRNVPLFQGAVAELVLRI